MGLSLQVLRNGIVQLLTPESSEKLRDFKFYSATDMQCLSILINLLKTKLNLLYIRNQSVPRCEHSTTVIKTNQ